LLGLFIDCVADVEYRSFNSSSAKDSSLLYYR
jgi:hypothetical protein